MRFDEPISRQMVKDDTPLLKKSNEDNTRQESTQDKPKFLSLDFDRIINSYSITATRARSKRAEEATGATPPGKDDITYSGISITRWVLTAMVGLCTGITAVVIVHCVDLLVEFRVTRLNRLMQFVHGHLSEQEMHKWYKDGYDWFFDWVANFGLWGVYVFYVGYNMLLVLLSTALCVMLAPMAVGSGIPEVKAYLNGVRVGEFAGMRLFLIKLFGTILGVSSGLVVGPEGPVVHLGAILGASMTRTGDMERHVNKFRKMHPSIGGCLGCSDHRKNDWIVGEKPEEEEPWWKRNSLITSLFFYLSHFRNDLERRHLISIGAAAGFASAFGAPVGGLLYSMEEASSFFSHDMLWKTLTATAVATFCIAVYYGNLTRYSMLSLEIGGTTESLLTQFSEVPLYFTMGVLGGSLGAVFNNVNAFLNNVRKVFYGRFSHKKRVYTTFKLLESAFLSALTSILMVLLVLKIGICRKAEAEDEEFRFIHRYNCAPGEINELGSLLFGSREESIKDILADPEDFKPETLLSVGLLFFALMMVTFGVALPTGMFMPSVLTGASLGGYVGLLIKERYIPSVHPSDFALIGAAAFLAGMQRNTVSLCVILIESTSQTKALIPIIITVVCARTVGDLLSEGIYEELMELKGYPFLKHESKPTYDMFTAGDVMSKSIPTIHMVMQAETIENLLLDSDHHAFPVVDKSGHYKGMVRRDQLIAVLECKIFIKAKAGDEINVGGDGDSIRDNSSDEDESERGWVHELKDDYTLMNRALLIDDGMYRSFYLGPRSKHNNLSDEDSTWLRSNVLTSENDDEIVFGMDETLPSGKVVCKESKATVKTLNGKVVILIPPSDRECHVDVGAIMNKCAFSVTEDCPLSRAFDIFTSMGLRHLPVLTDSGKVVGMITRYELSDEHVHEKTKDL